MKTEAEQKVQREKQTKRKANKKTKENISRYVNYLWVVTQHH